jgi:peptide/nickel transport system permease protein
MLRFISRRLLAIPLVVILANLVGFIYAYYLGPIQSTLRPNGFEVIKIPFFVPSYLEYLRGAIHLNFGILPNGGTVIETIAKATGASAGILITAFLLSITIGLFLGKAGVHSEPPRVSRWLIILSTIGQSSPTFYIGILLISASILYLLSGLGNKTAIPFQGFGWDAHMILPVLALMVRPTLQIAHVTANLMIEELSKQYVIAMRGFGYTMGAIRRRFAFRNIIAQVFLVIAGSWRLLIVELIILEWMFNWPGLGKLFASTLITTSRSSNFLYPPLFATLLGVLAFLFMAADLIATVAARESDPRLFPTEH